MHCKPLCWLLAYRTANPQKTGQYGRFCYLSPSKPDISSDENDAMSKQLCAAGNNVDYNKHLSQ